MKRNEIITSLLKEGFSEKTLVNFNDKQLLELASRILSESDVMISKKDPQASEKINAAKQKNQSIETYEEEVDEELKGNQKKIDKNKNGKIDAEDFKLLNKSKKKNSMSELTIFPPKKNKGLKESNYHSFTSKSEIMELINIKLNEMEVGPNVRKGHNGVPEFMSWDAISNSEMGDTITKPSPTKPKVDPDTKPRTPYSPKPGEKSKPKALKEKNGTITKPSPTKPKVNPGTKPSTPYSPKPGDKSKPKMTGESSSKK